VENGGVKVYVVSDKTQPMKGQLRVRLMDFDGKVLLEETREVKVAPLASQVDLDWPLKKLADAGAADTSRVFVEAELRVDGAEVSRNMSYLAPVREVHLIPAALKVETGGGNGSYTVRISSQVLARSVYLSFGNLDVKLSDNYFDILPGETVEIGVKTAASLEAVKAQLKVISLSDAFSTGGGGSASVSAAR
jgi:beta-mannosidase